MAEVATAGAPPTRRLIVGAAIIAVGLSAKVIGPIIIVNGTLPAETKAVLSAVVFLGGGFWDKLRALFIQGAKVKFPDRVANV